jgi:hypothetical protein
LSKRHLPKIPNIVEDGMGYTPEAARAVHAHISITQR